MDYINGLEGSDAVTSIVKGVTFLLLPLTSEDALSRLTPPERISEGGLGEWDGLVGLYFFYKRKDAGRLSNVTACWLAKERARCMGVQFCSG